MIKKIYSYAVMVRNENKAVKWYTEKLGWKIVDNYKGWKTVAPKGAKNVIHLCQVYKGQKLEPGNQGIALYSDNIDKTYKQLEKKGVEFPMPPKDMPWGRMATFKDPDGNEFSLF
jgi:predicted enzyme related to lactoylglutathione lyase